MLDVKPYGDRPHRTSRHKFIDYTTPFKLQELYSVGWLGKQSKVVPVLN